MIKRTIKKEIVSSLKKWPITLIAGAKKVGKTTLCKEIAKENNYQYVSLDSTEVRQKALNNPTKFIEDLGGKHVVIDEVQYAPILFDVLTSIVNETRLNEGNAKACGLFILISNKAFHLMKGVTQSMVGRVNIINMSNLSLNEIYNQSNLPFEINNQTLLENEKQHKYLFDKELFKIIHNGFYPEIYADNIENISPQEFYSNYLNTYIDRDVRSFENIKDYSKFLKFITIIASYSGQEFVKNNIANELQVSIHTVDNWTSILEASNLISFVQPYYENSIKKRIIKRNKLYMNDTGLLCFLLGIYNSEEIESSNYKGAIFETFIYNEITKSYLNNRFFYKIYFYRDKHQNEIDFIILINNKLNLVEVKSGKKYTLGHIKSFDILNQSNYQINGKCIISTTENSYTLKNDLLVFPYNVV